MIRVIRVLVYEGEEAAVLRVLSKSHITSAAFHSAGCKIHERERYEDITIRHAGMKGTPLSELLKGPSDAPST